MCGIRLTVECTRQMNDFESHAISAATATATAAAATAAANATAPAATATAAAASTATAAAASTATAATPAATATAPAVAAALAAAAAAIGGINSSLHKTQLKPLDADGSSSAKRSSSKSPSSASAHHSKVYRQKYFEFVIADIEEIVPVVKTMHILDLCEGLMMSIAAESRQKSQLDDDPGRYD
jgi:hypothetical protein